MFNNKKLNRAFTLIELMAVVIILGIVSTLTIASVNYAIKQSKLKLYTEQIKRLQAGVENWAINNTDVLPTTIEGRVFFDIAKLLDEGIIDSDLIKDPRDDSDLAGCIMITYEDTYNQYEYEYVDTGCETLADTYEPTITVAGGANQFVEVNSLDYELPEATAVAYSGEAVSVVGPIIKQGSTIVTSLDLSTVGTVYTLTYQATDEKADLTQEEVITLTVNDTIKPVITVNGDTRSFIMTHEAHPLFSAPTATVTDNSCGLSGTDGTKNSCTTTLTAVLSGSVTPKVPNTYTLTYTAEDSSNNVKYFVITVNVEDTKGPSAPTYAIKHINSGGASYASTWTQDNIWIGNLASTDDGVGVDYYRYSVGCTGTWTNLGAGVDNFTVSSETNAQEVCLQAVDNIALASTSTQSTQVKIDRTAPTCTLAVTAGTAGDNGWHKSDMTITNNRGADWSGISAYDTTKSATPSYANNATTTQTTETASQTIYGYVRDGANNVGSCTYTAKLDKTNPTCSLAVTAGTAGDNGWYRSDMTISNTRGDTLSGVQSYDTTKSATPSYANAASTTQTTDIASQIIYGYVKDNAGNVNNCSTTVKLDKTNPTCSLAVTAGTAGDNGWYKSDMTISNTRNDATSGVVSYDTTKSATPSYSNAASTTQTTEIASQTIYGYVRDGAGNIGNCTYVAKLDKTAPTCSLAVTAGTAGDNGWYKSDITISNTRNADLSGVTAYDTTKSASASYANNPSTTQTTDVASQTIYGYVQDGAGWTNSCSTTVKLDKTAPTCSLAVTVGTAGDNGWYTTDMTITNTRDADLSNIASYDTTKSSTPSYLNNATTTQTTETASQTIYGYVRDGAGNIGSCTYVAKLDKTNPTCSLAVTAGTAGNNDWYRSDMTITNTRNADISNIASYDTTKSATPSYANAASITQTSSTSGTTIYGYVKDNSGRVGSCTYNAKLDETLPTCTGVTLSGTKGTSAAPNDDWYRSTVSGTIAGAADTYSGIMTTNQPPSRTTATTTTAVTMSGTLVDYAGNSRTCTSAGFRIDLTAPSLAATRTCVRYACPGYYMYEITVGTDGLSGMKQSTVIVSGISGSWSGQNVAAVETPNYYTSLTLTSRTIIDHAGNTTTSSTQVTTATCTTGPTGYC